MCGIRERIYRVVCPEMHVRASDAGSFLDTSWQRAAVTDLPLRTTARLSIMFRSRPGVTGVSERHVTWIAVAVATSSVRLQLFRVPFSVLLSVSLSFSAITTDKLIFRAVSLHSQLSVITVPCPVKTARHPEIFFTHRCSRLSLEIVTHLPPLIEILSR